MIPAAVWQSFGGMTAKVSTPADPEAWFIDWAIGKQTSSGQRVTTSTAMRLSAVYACVRNRSDDVAKLPCPLYKTLPGGGKERIPDDPRYVMINATPNPRMTAMEFRAVMQANVDLHGNAYAWKEFNGRGELIALWPLSPNIQVYVSPDGRDLWYQVIGGDVPQPPVGMGSRMFAAEEILHLRGPSLNGYTGLSVIAYHRETIGMAQAALEYGAAFFGNSAIPQGGIKTPKVLQPDAAAKLRSDWETKFRGSENAGRLAIFDGGMEWTAVGVDNKDAQYIESRKFSNDEIYALWRMPPHKAGNLERSTNNNIEHQALEYVIDCLLSELIRWEQTLTMSLLSEEERKTMFFEHLVDGLLRGDIQTRYAAYAVARNWGILNADEIREMENRNPIPGGGGKVYLQPLNMTELGKFPAPKPLLPAPSDQPSDQPSEEDKPPPKKTAYALLAFAKELVAREEAKSNGDGR